MWSRLLWGVWGLPLLALLAGAGALHLGNQPQTEPALPTREYGSPNGGQAPSASEGGEPRSFLGVIVAGASVDITTTVESRIESISVQLGDHIRKGRIIATLDSNALRREMEVAEAELLAARAEEEASSYMVAEATERLGRRVDPRQLQTGALSEEELAAARYQERLATARHNSARARVRQQEARIKQIHQRLSETTLVAPFDAVVGRRYVDP